MTTHKDFEFWYDEAGEEAAHLDRATERLVSRLQQRLKETGRLKKLAEKDALEAEKRLAIAYRLAEERTELAPIGHLGKILKSRNRAIPVFLNSDWHVEESVDPKTVNGRNEYGPKIAEQRAAYLAQGQAWFIKQWAKAYNIKQIVYWLGGDLITGYIHEELMESNMLSPTEATLLASELVTRNLRYIMKECPFLQKITVICNYGNHGRTSPRKKFKTAAKNSYEWLMYQTLKRRWEGEPRVEWQIAGGTHIYQTIGGCRVRWHHGDDIGYQGGIGGLTIPLKKKVLAWNKFEPADLTVIGHWHQHVDYGYCYVNGSLIGYNAYAVAHGFEWEPPRQGSFLLEEGWGKRAVTPIYCDPERKVT